MFEDNQLAFIAYLLDNLREPSALARNENKTAKRGTMWVLLSFIV